MERYRWNTESFRPQNWIIAVIGITAVLALLVIGNRTSLTERAEQAAISSPAGTTGSGTGADSATQSAPSESTRGEGPQNTPRQ